MGGFHSTAQDDQNSTTSAILCLDILHLGSCLHGRALSSSVLSLRVACSASYGVSKKAAARRRERCRHHVKLRPTPTISRLRVIYTRINARKVAGQS
jgi:hypothetical protein